MTFRIQAIDWLNARVDELEAELARLKAAGGLSQADLFAACVNVGVDLNCGRCAGQFFTGSSMSAHDAGCSTKEPAAVPADVAGLVAVLRIGQCPNEPGKKCMHCSAADALEALSLDREKTLVALRAVDTLVHGQDGVDPENAWRVPEHVLEKVEALARENATLKATVAKVREAAGSKLDAYSLHRLDDVRHALADTTTMCTREHACAADEGPCNGFPRKDRR